MIFQWGTYSNNTSQDKTTHNLPTSFTTLNANAQIASTQYQSGGTANYSISTRTLSTITIYASGIEERKYPFMILAIGY